MQNRVGIRLLIHSIRDSRSAGTILISSAFTAAPALGAGGSSLSSGALRAVAGRFGAALYHSPSLRFKKAMYSDFLTALSLSNRRLEHVGCDLLGVA
jgi:hypothetical protein